MPSIESSWRRRLSVPAEWRQRISLLGEVPELPILLDDLPPIPHASPFLIGLSDDTHPIYTLRSILTVDGDLYLRSGGVVSRLGVGAPGSFLGVAGGLPAYVAQSYIDHNSIGNLAVGDVHSQYAFLGGRSGGQTLRGGAASGNSLFLSSTADPTKGLIGLGSLSAYNEANDRLGLGITSPAAKLQIVGSENIIQLRVRGFSTQTAVVARFDTSGIVPIMTLSNTGTLVLGGSTLQGRMTITSDHVSTGMLALSQTTLAATGLSLGALNILVNLNNVTSGVNAVNGLFLTMLVDNGKQNIVGINAGVTASAHSSVPGVVNLYGLQFFASTEGATALADVLGMTGIANHVAAATVVRLAGLDAQLYTASGVGLASAALGLDVTQLYEGDVTAAYGVRIREPLITSVIATLYGLYLGNQTGATTNWAIYSLGGNSSHLGNWRAGSNVAPTAKMHLAAGSATANTAPLQFDSGPVETVARVGVVEYTTDDLFFTIATGTARKRLLMADPVGGLTSGKIPVATTNGRLADLAASAAYIFTNVTTDRVLNADSVTLDELADVVGTIGADLQAKGILG